MSKKELDRENMGVAIYDFPDHLADALTIGQRYAPKSKFDAVQNIVVAGMGGSAIGGDVSRVLTAGECKVPIIVTRNYRVPNWVNNRTMVVCSSYSGNTEESLAALDDATLKGAQICGISTGGTLAEKLLEQNCDLIKIPDGLQPRAALAYSLVPLLLHFFSQGLISAAALTDINESIAFLKEKRDLYNQKDNENPTYTLANAIYNSIPIIYGTTDSTAVAALRLKGQFCENADMLAYHNELPEMNHNEIVGWENNSNIFDHLSVLWIEDTEDHERIKLRQRFTYELIAEKNVRQHVIAVDGSNANVRFLHLINFGDWLSYWCAILHGADPTPVKPIKYLKDKLSQS